jgi:hypothetical protein
MDGYMKRTLNRLSAAHLRRLPDGLHNDGGGLHLRVRGDQRTWLMRYQLQGQRHEMGLGTLADVPLAQARDMSAEARKQLAMGQDPLETRRHAAASAARSMTFKEAAEAYIADHDASWRNAKHRAQWGSTLTTYAYPVIAGLAVSAVETADMHLR